MCVEEIGGRQRVVGRALSAVTAFDAERDCLGDRRGDELCDGVERERAQKGRDTGLGGVGRRRLWLAGPVLARALVRRVTGLRGVRLRGGGFVAVVRLRRWVLMRAARVGSPLRGSFRLRRSRSCTRRGGLRQQLPGRAAAEQRPYRYGENQLVGEHPAQHLGSDSLWDNASPARPVLYYRPGQGSSPPQIRPIPYGGRAPTTNPHRPAARIGRSPHSGIPAHSRQMHSRAPTLPTDCRCNGSAGGREPKSASQWMVSYAHVHQPSGFRPRRYALRGRRPGVPDAQPVTAYAPIRGTTPPRG